jgi:hypothetical protein
MRDFADDPDGFVETALAKRIGRTGSEQPADGG